ncbi:MAG TPA: NnrS family protein [Methylomirabilota bacterium]|nr:NnrS family protein [Methylomirabilota bacterium]
MFHARLGEQLERLRQEPAWRAGDRSAITLFKTPALTLVLLAPRRRASPFPTRLERVVRRGPDRDDRSGAMSREPLVYRPFALLGLAATLAVGIPLGVWLLAWLYLGAAAVPAEWLLLHAHVQIFGFFGTLIMGVAQHLLPRFTGRPVSASPFMLWLLGLQAAAIVLRIAGTAGSWPVPVLVASLLQAGAFLLFAAWVWRMLDPPPLGFLRRHLTVSTLWLACACGLEAWLRVGALAAGLALPVGSGFRVVHLMGLFGGVLGWVLGVLLRAAPMFLARWRAPARSARVLPWLLALGVGIAAWGEAGDWSAAVGTALARLGEVIVLAGAAAVMVLGGALTRVRDALPLVARSPQESRIFRVAMLSGAAAAVGSAVAVPAAWAGLDVRLLTDMVRHLVTVGVLTSVVVAMAFRLIPVLEGRPLRWPRLRHVALWSLAAGVVLRSGEVLVGVGWSAPAPWVALSGVLIWIAVACVGANLAGAIGTHEDSA